MRHVCLSIRRGELLIEFLNGGLGPRGGIWVPDCRAELAVVHGYAHRLLVFDLPDQLALRITQRAGDIRVLGDRYERRKARQACTQYDTLLLAPRGPATRRSPPHLADATFPGGARASTASPGKIDDRTVGRAFEDLPTWAVTGTSGVSGCSTTSAVEG